MLKMIIFSYNRTPNSNQRHWNYERPSLYNFCESWCISNVASFFYKNLGGDSSKMILHLLSFETRNYVTSYFLSVDNISLLYELRNVLLRTSLRYWWTRDGRKAFWEFFEFVFVKWQQEWGAKFCLLCVWEACV